MKNFTFFIILLFSITVFAQKLNRPEPESWKMASIENVSPIVLEKPDLSILRAEDKINDLIDHPRDSDRGG